MVYGEPLQETWHDGELLQGLNPLYRMVSLYGNRFQTLYGELLRETCFSW